MKAKIACIALAMAVVAPAWAAEDPIGDLSDITGLSERKVQMILGVRSSFAEYPYTYQRSLEKFVSAVGKENYEDLMRGESIALRDRDGREVVIQIHRDDLNAL